MRRNMMVAGVTGVLVCLSLWWTGAALGQNRPSGSASFEAHVALVDLAYLFKNYEKFNRLSKELRDDVAAKEKEIAQAQKDLKLLQEKRNSFNPDTPNFKDADEQFGAKKVALERITDQYRRQFTQREASLYHQTYQEIEDAIAKYAEPKGITLVLRSSRDPEPGSASNPQEVMKEMSQQVLYALPQMDITSAILEMLNRNSGVAKQPPATNKPTNPPKGPSQPVKNANDPNNKTGTMKR